MQGCVNMVDSRGEGKERWVAYLDILGFGDFVERNSTEDLWHATSRKVAQVLDSVAQIRRAEEHAEDWTRDMTVSMFSDSVAISTRDTDAFGAQGIVHLVSLVAATFPEYGLFVRGAIVRGHHYEMGPAMFSPALVAAVKLEEDLAVFPRVVAASDVVRDVASRAREIDDDPPRRHYMANVLWEDVDGIHFVNYLHRFNYAPLASHEEPYVLESLRRHRHYILLNSGRYTDRPRILAKYRWLATYHNRFCRETVSEGDRDDLLIEDAPLRVTDERVSR